MLRGAPLWGDLAGEPGACEAGAEAALQHGEGLHPQGQPSRCAGVVYDADLRAGCPVNWPLALTNLYVTA